MAKLQNLPLTEKQKSQLVALGFKEEEIDNQTLIDVTLYKQALSGNVTALNTIKKMLESKDDEPDIEAEDITKEVEKEEKDLLASLSGLSATQLKINSELIHNCAFLSVQLRHLSEDIAKNGVKEKYKNGANQWGYKDRTEVRTYNNMIKAYQSCMKQLNDLAKENIGGFVDDEQNPFQI